MINVLIAAGALATIGTLRTVMTRQDMIIGALQSRPIGAVIVGLASVFFAYFVILSTGIGLLRLIWQAIAR